jgi:hypothetical protein
MSLAVQVTFDAADPAELAGSGSACWATSRTRRPKAGTPGSLGDGEGHPRERWNDQSAIVDPDGNGPRIFFQKVPEAKAGKNRVHLDVRAAPGWTPTPVERG